MQPCLCSSGHRGVRPRSDFDNTTRMKPQPAEPFAAHNCSTTGMQLVLSLKRNSVWPLFRLFTPWMLMKSHQWAMTLRKFSNSPAQHFTSSRSSFSKVTTRSRTRPDGQGTHALRRFTKTPTISWISPRSLSALLSFQLLVWKQVSRFSNFEHSMLNKSKESARDFNRSDLVLKDQKDGSRLHQ
jgi:hypothetical protein